MMKGALPNGKWRHRSWTKPTHIICKGDYSKDNFGREYTNENWVSYTMEEFYLDKWVRLGVCKHYYNML